MRLAASTAAISMLQGIFANKHSLAFYKQQQKNTVFITLFMFHFRVSEHGQNVRWTLGFDILLIFQFSNAAILSLFVIKKTGENQTWKKNYVYGAKLSRHLVLHPIWLTLGLQLLQPQCISTNLLRGCIFQSSAVPLIRKRVEPAASGGGKHRDFTQVQQTT